jgi:hypothetical protein
MSAQAASAVAQKSARRESRETILPRIACKSPKWDGAHPSPGRPAQILRARPYDALQPFAFSWKDMA